MDNNVNSTSSAGIYNILAELPQKIPYNDTEVLTNDTEELRLVNYFFSSISSHNQEVETLLYEVIGYSLCKTAKLNKAFIFKGKGRNGKSVIFRIIEKLVGAKQCSHEHLEKLSGSKAGSKTTIKALSGCTVNIAEDQKQPKYINTSILTRLISGEPISVEQTGNHRIELTPKVTMLFSVNEVIDFKETGIYIKDRFLVIPFNETFTDDNSNRDINIVEKLCEDKAQQIIATRAIQAFSKVLKTGKFTIPSIVEEETKRYFRECNNVEEFCSELPLKTIITKSQYYDEYCNWCKSNNREAVSSSKFGKEVLALGYRAERYQFEAKRDTYYASPDFNNSDSKNVYDKYRKQHDNAESKGTNNEISFNNYLVECLYNINDNIENG
ncbi:MAG: phage/plasmid primase, P4 family [Clostridium sp.]|nr:phage/plasmid primase, P4 family [Clostridium sp.]MCM1444178.1 phage/plasmid primase, P4 family [Candidatus Amulumruptor caecigallinarius]